MEEDTKNKKVGGEQVDAFFEWLVDELLRGGADLWCDDDQQTNPKASKKSTKNY